jgi:hypothetical protein
MLRAIYVLALVLSATALKMNPPPILNEGNFVNLTGVSLEAFLQNGSSTHNPWMLLFKIPECKHCIHAEMFFQSLFVEYNKRLHFEKDTVKDRLETDLQFAIVDWYLMRDSARRAGASVQGSALSNTPRYTWWRGAGRFAIMWAIACRAT